MVLLLSTQLVRYFYTLLLLAPGLAEGLLDAKSASVNIAKKMEIKFTKMNKTIEKKDLCII